MTLERRTHSRTNLRVPVFLLPAGWTVPIQTETEDVGVDGFLCYSPYLLSPGECLRFVLFLPAAGADAQSIAGVCVHGEAEVVRVSIGPVANYGVGCRLCSYRILPDSNLLPVEEAVATILHSKVS